MIMDFVSQQPNGRYCRFSGIVDTVTNYNMTAEEYIEMCAERARINARFELKHCLVPFSQVKNCFLPTNDSVEDFNDMLKAMGDNEQLNPEDFE
jgi:hypothetical protein